MQDVASIRRAAAIKWQANVPKLTNLAGGRWPARTRRRATIAVPFVHHGQACPPNRDAFSHGPTNRPELFLL